MCYREVIHAGVVGEVCNGEVTRTGIVEEVSDREVCYGTVTQAGVAGEVLDRQLGVVAEVTDTGMCCKGGVSWRCNRGMCCKGCVLRSGVS